ncbi:dihydrolipoamide acetyltransferase family protein [Streptomyces sp. KMM 9044]|uniref:dihydrolipoamide acetyltransferase family protein n=1 Tax=Streptomyces sp. KMM 9044 TaxID=2744474 RepID=UPI002151B6CC|nr:dihydrolipoamide acetyltransferase family protein [Streptomyces sp. KMM 9044]WAX79162.1 dihydrolipoamide acetyltransferase family protein [Streptomyces sp. KMM 9044]
MAEVLEFKLPDLGEGLTGAEIVRWLVEVGEVVAVDQPVVEVETAKAMVDVPCPYGGVVTARFGDEGAEVPVGAPLITVAVGGPADEDGRPARETPSTTDGSPADAPRAAVSRAKGPQPAGSGNVLVGYGTSEAPARRRRARPGRPAPSAPASPAASTASSPATANGWTAAEGQAPAARQARTAAGAVDGPVPVISPLVRRLARQHGLDLREMSGSGPEGLILRADVEYALRAAGTQSGRDKDRTPTPSTEPRAPRTPAQEPAPSQVYTPAVGVPTASESARIPLKGVRGVMAGKLSRSRTEIPDATCWVDADATELMRARDAMRRFAEERPQSPAAGGPKISVLALLARICTAALTRFPELNSSVDMTAREVVQHRAVHLGFAAQTERGLVVPVVRDAHTRNAESLTAEFARLTEAARTGTLPPAELTGGTFTLNNYGVFGVDGSTPIINHPEAAMLGVGRIVPKPWVHEGELAVRQVVQLSLTFDHRVCDGGTAGGFLRYVADCVEQPAVLLRTL